MGPPGLQMAHLLVLGALAAGLGGCDYFRPAQPEPPLGAVIIPDYSSPDATLASMALAIADKATTNGGAVYAGAFAESTTAGSPAAYHHFFWPDDAFRHEQGGRTVPDWGLTLERFFYNRFVSLRGDRYRMEWVPDDLNPDDIRPDLAIIHRHYLITTETEDGATTSTLTVGFADLTMHLFPDGSWRIGIWQDRLDPDADPTDPEAVTLGRRRLNSSQ